MRIDREEQYFSRSFRQRLVNNKKIDEQIFILENR
jgi:hypothetical protein